jgi:RNase P subunit RPR2
MKYYLLYITFLFISTPTLHTADWQKHLTKKVYASEEERQQARALQEKRKVEYKIWKETTYFCELCNLTLKQKGNGRIESHKAREHGVCHDCGFQSHEFFEMTRHLNTHLPTNAELKKHAVDEE